MYINGLLDGEPLSPLPQPTPRPTPIEFELEEGNEGELGEYGFVDDIFNDIINKNGFYFYVNCKNFYNYCYGEPLCPPPYPASPTRNPANPTSNPTPNPSEFDIIEGENNDLFYIFVFENEGFDILKNVFNVHFEHFSNEINNDFGM